MKKNTNEKQLYELKKGVVANASVGMSTRGFGNDRYPSLEDVLDLNKFTPLVSRSHQRLGHR